MPRQFDVVRTDRLLMRRWREEDREPFAAMNADREVMRYFPAPLDRAASDALMDRIEDLFQRQGFGLWALEVAAPELPSTELPGTGLPGPGLPGPGLPGPGLPGPGLPGPGLPGPGLPGLGEFIGFTGLNPMPAGVPGAGGMEVGWRLARAAWHHGYATEAATAAAGVAFGGPG